MTSPAYSIAFSAQVSGAASTGSAGDVLIPDATTGLYVKATSANRGTRRSTGVALTAYSPNQTVEIQQTGQLDATTAGLGAGAASWIRVSSTGVLERVTTPSSSDDVCGWMEADGTAHLMFGVLTPSMAGATTAAQAMSSLNVDWSTGAVFTKTLASGANAITFSNQSSGQVIVVRLTGSSSTVSWPGTVKWAGGSAPTQTASGIDVYTFIYDGTSTYGSYVQAMA